MVHFISWTKTITATGLSTLLVTYIVRIHALPHNIVFNHGTQFNLHFWKAILQTFDIQHDLTSAFSPQIDGQIACTYQMLEQYLHIYMDPDQLNWVLNLLLAELAYNSMSHNSIETSPFMTTYRFEVPINLDTELLPNLMPTVHEWTNQITDNHILVKYQL